MSASLVAHRFRTHKRLGAGSFGEIFVGSDVNTGMRVAMKFEKHGLRCPQLRHEYKVYRELQGCRGVCKVQYYGTHNNFNVMILDLLGPSLEELFTKCGRRFSLKTTLKLADQMLERCEALHGRHLIHRDIKPANFTMGDATTSPMVYCIDFGLSKRFRNPHTLQHIPHRVGKSLTGTPRYASISNHLGIEQSRRDDLEAIGYVLVYFAKGRLPWQGLKAKSAHKKYKLILDKKQEISIAQLCHGCPAQFAEYLSYCRSLKFDASPNVAYHTGQEMSDSSSLQHERSARARSGQSIHASRALREMIARPKISRNEWKTTDIGAFEVGNFAPFCCPGPLRPSRRVRARLVGRGAPRVARGRRSTGWPRGLFPRSFSAKFQPTWPSFTTSHKLQVYSAVVVAR